MRVHALFVPIGQLRPLVSNLSFADSDELVSSSRTGKSAAVLKVLLKD